MDNIFGFIGFLLILSVIPVSIIILKQFDKVAGRDLKDINSKNDEISKDMMACPKCAESIKKAAQICRFCGYKIHNDK